MTDVPAEVVARGRAIFDRLRGAVPPTPDAPPADEVAPAPLDPGADRSAADPAGPSAQVDGSPPPPDPSTTHPRPAIEPVDEASPAPELPATELRPAAEPPTAGPESAGVPANEASWVPKSSEVEAQPAVESVDGASPVPVPEPPAADPEAPAADLRSPAESVRPPAPTDFVPDETPRDLEVPATEATEALVSAPEPEPEPEPASRFARALPRVIAVANQKGGVGKTTTTVNLAACLADLGYRVLIVDLDPQGNASTGVGINIRDLTHSMYDVLLHDAPMEDCIEATSVRNLYVAPANLELAGAEIELVPAFSRELKLRAAIDGIKADYDFVFVDCPPSLGLLTVNSLAAASEVLVPIQCEYYALEGLGQLLRNVGLVQKNLNPALEVSVIVCVMYDARTKLADQVVAEVRTHFGDKVCRTVVPRTVRLSEAPSYGQPISAFDPSSRGAIAYKELAKEVGGGAPQRVG